MTMKALSIRQPWAWLIVQGFKDIENRTWPTRFRGRVLIHASKGMTKAEYEDVELFAEGLQLPAREDLERGGIVGVAMITDCVLPAHRKSIWHMAGQFGFQLADAKPVPFVECKGALGFFNVPHDIAAVLREMHDRHEIA
ncbi:ASCH domain-containing protein [Burkholderia pseudomallei]|uniref:ASCH domain-containing protein n=1 Tax=Burkholderia pseudomallei TaxID=28450 RepID=UPI002180BA77|nr:ASCH domain-containing protein [Burkholderia pseudomallei]